MDAIAPGEQLDLFPINDPETNEVSIIIDGFELKGVHSIKCSTSYSEDVLDITETVLRFIPESIEIVLTLHYTINEDFIHYISSLFNMTNNNVQFQFIRKNSAGMIIHKKEINNIGILSMSTEIAAWQNTSVLCTMTFVK